MVRLLEAVPAKSRFRARAPLILGLLVFLALGALYWSYVSRRSAYLIDRDLRLLSAAAAQLDQQIDSHKGVLRNFAHADFWCGEGGDGRTPITEYGPSSPAWLRRYMPDYIAASRGSHAKVSMLAAGSNPSSTFSEQLVPNGDGSYNVEVQYQSATTAWDEHSPCAPKDALPRAIGQFPLADLVKPIFNKPIFGGAFDAVLVASSDGRVLYQAEPRAQQERRSVWNRITPAASADANMTSSLLLTGLGNLRDVNSKDDKTINPWHLQSQTGSVDVEISGSTYRLLTQPYAYDAPPVAGVANIPGSRWIVCGLIEKRRFMQEATEISASLIALATAALILVACCWPFMKLAFSGAAEPITRSDVVMVAVAVLLATAIVSLTFLDMVIYGRMKSIADYQHRAFAVHIGDEIRFALEGLLSVRDELEAATRFQADAYEEAAAKHHPDAARASLDPEAFLAATGRDFDGDWLKNETSLFSSFAWVNEEGMQVIRASMTKGMPPLLDVSKRAYFQNVVKQKRFWTSSDRADDRIHLRVKTFDFEPTPESEAAQRKKAEEFRQSVIGTNDGTWPDTYITRSTLHEAVQRVISGMQPLEVTSVIRASDKYFFVDQLVEKPKRQQFVIESVRTLTNGQPEAVIGFPTGRKTLPLFTITFPFAQLVERLGPPAMSYAVVDNAGTVLFHTDSERNGLENIFTETDHNRQLRAAVIAHHEEFIDAKYWGEDVRILVTPLRDVPWTLLTFRDKRLLRTMNLETLVISLLLFLMCLGIPLALVVGIMLARPSYRARWAWPLHARYSDWRDLFRLYVVSLLAFAICTYTFASLPRLLVGFMMPLQVLLGTYLLLDRTPKRLAHGLAVAVWSVLTIGMFVGIIAADMYGQVLPFTAASWIVRGVLFILAATAVHAVLIRHAPVNVPWRKFARVYAACGVLIVVVMAVLPMTAFFQTAVGNEVEAVVKAGQLDIANRLLRRMEVLTEKSWNHESNMALWYHMPFFFESTWCIQTDGFSATPETFGHLRRPCDCTSTARGGHEFHPTEPFMPAGNDVGEQIEALLPQYSDQTISMRDLHHGMAGDQSWYTLRAGRVLTLFRRLDLNDDTRNALVKQLNISAERRAAGHVAHALREQGKSARDASVMAAAAAEKAKKVVRPDGTVDPAGAAQLKPIERDALRYIGFIDHQASRLAEGGQWLVVLSRMPLVFPTAFAPDDPVRPFPRSKADLTTGENDARASFPGPPPDEPWPAPLRRIPILMAVLAAAGGLLWAIRFIARRIFLYDLREPDWLRALPLRPPFSDHLFVISAEEQVEKLIDVGDCCRIRFREYSRSGARSEVLERVGRAAAPSHVLVEDFGYRIADAEFTKWKFDLLGSLVQLGDRTIIVVSPVPPTLLLTAIPDVEDALRERWSATLRSFVWIDSARNLAPPVIETSGVAAAPTRRVRRFFVELDQAVHHRLRGLRWWIRQFTARGRQRRDRADDLRWLRRETRASALLRQFRPQLQEMEGGREQMMDELCERTDKYYDALWQMCGAQERVVLFHIAHHGVANASNRRIIRRLLTRGLLTREPELRIFNDTFRMFICSREEDVRKENQLDPAAVTAWDQLRLPLFIGLLAVAAVFLGTQKELANATSAIVTALATGLPVIVKLIGTFTDRRLAAAQR